MSLNSTPQSERVHIGIFGNRNAGKSSLINAITSQDVSVVSDVKGTTTDAVKRAMEILPLGPVVFIDTPGLDDDGRLGISRVQRALDTIASCDIVILVLDVETAFEEIRQPAIVEFIDRIRQSNIPMLVVFNKIDASLIVPLKGHMSSALGLDDDMTYQVSAVTGEGIDELREAIGHIAVNRSEGRLVSDLIGRGDDIILVIPIDESAPKGRLILPQQQVIRDALDCGALIHIVQDSEYERLLDSIDDRERLLVVTDSQVFDKVAKATPREIRLTSFSILMSRYKGDLQWQAKGASMISKLANGDKVLISEACTHHRQCNDIGSVKLPHMIKKASQADVEFDYTSGDDFPRDLSKYKLIVHCGGCMINANKMKERIDRAKRQGVAITNYGTAIAYMNNILDRCMSVFDNG